MTDILYNYLKESWLKSNHRKYHKYFVEWISNITSQQEFFFEKERLSILNGDKIKK